ncbi:OmpH family outer membrane protein [Carboxylicivirga linearis]|uniref:OmpH family outer membrane protein n=1 Tax=Carboxylicivirga linearis TaxID=1628157 RepID=A0ABS5JSV4_9BACT|nr:OmpH family outer membrane protein [Carboxylicivirga linearis]MBS2097880.1 OmpH family outer membrane protein [Carboxylicivirga linearis]
MKQLSTVLNGILLLAVIILYALHFSGKKEAVVQEKGQAMQADGAIYPVAFINTDSLLLNYNFAKEVNDQLMSKEEASRADYAEKAKIFQQDAVDFQRKVQTNAFLSQDRFNKERDRLAKAEQDLQVLNQRLTNELMQEQDKLNRQLRDTLESYLKEFAEDKPYKVILSNTLGDNVLYGADGVDITQEITNALNERHKAAKK